MKTLKIPIYHYFFDLNFHFFLNPQNIHRQTHTQNKTKTKQNKTKQKQKQKQKQNKNKNKTKQNKQFSVASVQKLNPTKTSKNKTLKNTPKLPKHVNIPKII